MNKRIISTLALLCCFFISVVAQNNSVTIKLLSSEPNKNDGLDYPYSFEYDSQNRVSRIVQTDEYGNEREISVSYGENSINVNDYKARYESTFQNGQIVKDIEYRNYNSNPSEIYTYTYDSNGKIIHINREVPPEPSRNTTYDLTWENGLLTKCIATKINNGTITEITFTYTDIEDRTLAHFYCSPFSYIVNYEIGEFRIMPLLDCHGIYGWQSTRLLQTVTYINIRGQKTEYTFSYERDSEGRVSSITNFYKNGNNSRTITTILHWDGSLPPPPTEDLPETDNNDVNFGNGGDIDENTDLDGNVVGNIYYNIGSGDGGYNSTEGCIVVNTPTSDDDIDGKDIFGEDFKDHFTGIVFKVGAGSGVIKVKAQTIGYMMLKVKIGSNAPFEMMLSGTVEASFPYSVSEPTYIYIYGGILSGSRSLRAAGENALKIYGISWQEGSSGMNVVDVVSPQNETLYNLNGQRITTPQPGHMYIRNRRKVLMK